jgi:hypothetical protein
VLRHRAGPDFAASAVAQALRDYGDAGSDAREENLEMSHEALGVFDEQFTRQAEGYEASGLSRPGLPSLADASGASDVIFVPYRDCQRVGCSLVDALATWLYPNLLIRSNRATWYWGLEPTTPY